MVQHEFIKHIEIHTTVLLVYVATCMVCKVQSFFLVKHAIMCFTVILKERLNMLICGPSVIGPVTYITMYLL
jgi:hypothetical protein